MGLASLFVAQVFSATTMMPSMTTKHHHGHHSHGTKPTHEPIEQDKHSFKYDPRSHHMMVVNHKACYIYQMSAQESQDVHTTHGLHTLEIKLITMIDDTTATYQSLSHDQLMAMSQLLAHSCRANDKMVM